MLRVLVVLAIGWGFAAGCTARQPSISLESSAGRGAPYFVPAQRFGSEPGVALDEPRLEVLSVEEESRLLAEAAQGRQLARYPYSGCHDRAHALYLRLAPRWSGKLAKVWVFAPLLLSPVSQEGQFRPLASGAVGLPQGAKVPEWEYHVALAYKSADGGLKVLDPVVSSGEFQELGVDAWFGMFEVPPGSAWTVLEADYYLFYRVNLPGRPRPTYFNGNFFKYSGPSREQRFIPRALARDVVGARLMQRSDCAQLEALRSDPGTLLDTMLNATAFDTPACQAHLEEFLQTEAFWTNALEESLAGSPQP